MGKGWVCTYVGSVCAYRIPIKYAILPVAAVTPIVRPILERTEVIARRARNN